MSTSLGEMTVKFGADVSGLKSGINSAKDALSGLSGAAGTIGRDIASAMVDMGRQAVGFGAESVKMAGDFQMSTTQLVTSAGEQQSQLEFVRQGILALGPAVGTSIPQLVSGMYMVESAGFHGSAGLQVLKIAAMGAKAEGADLATVTNAVTSGLNAYAMGADKASFVTNVLVATTAAGKMHMQDLAASLGSILPVASKAGVSIQETGAAIATMTSLGTPAAQATTYLRQMLVNLEAPGSKAVKTLAEIGLSSTQVAQDMRKQPDGVINTLQEISVALSKKFPESAAIANAEFAKVKAGHESMDTALAHLANNTSPQYIEALKNIAGGSKNMMAMMELTGPQLGVFRDNLNSITDAANKGKDGIAGWSDIQGNFNFQMDSAKAAVEALMIGIGTQFLPVVTKIVGAVAPVISLFTDWITKSNAIGKAFDGLGKILSPFSVDVGQLSDAFNAVFAPIQKVADVTKPLTDSFDRAKNIFSQTQQAAKPLTDTFDRARGIIQSTTPVVKPLMDSFDRGKSILADSAKSFSDVQKTVNPLIPLFTSLKPYVADVVSLFHIGQDVFSTLAGVISNDIVPAIGDLVSSVSPIIDNFITWEDKTHFLQNTLNDVGSFIRRVADDVANNLMPPVRSMISAFQDWLAKSGFVHDALGILGVVIDKISGFVGGLATGLAAVFNWFGQDAGRATALKDAIFAIGAVIAGIKIAQFGQSVFDTFNAAKKNVSDFIGVLGDIKNKAGDVMDFLKTKFGPGASGAMNTVSTSADGVATAEKGIGTTAMESEVKVATASTLEDTELGTVATTADTTAVSVAGIGTAATTMGGIVGGIITGLTGLMYGLMAAALAVQVWVVGLLLSHGFGAQAPNLPPGYKGPKGWATGGTNIPGGRYVVGEEGPEIMDVPGGSNIYANGTYPSNNVYPSTPSSTPLQGSSGVVIQNHNHLYLDGQELVNVLLNPLGQAIVDRIRAERPVAA